MSNLQLNDAVLPLLFQVSDQASIKAQSSYYRWLQFYLILLVVAAVPTAIVSEENGKIGAVISLISFTISLFMLIWRNKSEQMETWYNSRAVAESTKTRAWRWAMRASPYIDNNSPQQSSQNFVEDLQNIIKQNKAFSRFDQSDVTIQNSISETMNSIRKLPTEKRLTLYREQRVKNQAQWYKNKTEFNKKRAQRWQWLSMLLHSVAIVLLTVRLFSETQHFPIEIITTLAGAALSWLEAKRYAELKASYKLAADEINSIQNKITDIQNDQDLSEFVLSSEAAFSREHTQWIARSSA